MAAATALLVLTVLATAGVVRAQEVDYPPGTFRPTPRRDLGLAPVEVAVPEAFRGLVPEGLTLNLPPGFSAQVYAATGLRGPRMMAWSPEGVLHVANMKAGGASEFGPAPDRQGGQIVALPDRNRDGVADTALVAAAGLWWANSLAFHQGGLYVADTDQVLRFTDQDGDGVYEGRQKVAGLPRAPEGQREHHVTRTMVFDESAGAFYVSVGSTCDLCRETDPERAAILRFNADGSARRVFARGLRNAVGLAIHPVTQQLWAVNNGHDRQGPSLPPEWIDIVRDGGFYGWPLAYGYQVWVDFGIRDYKDALFPLTRQDSLDVESMKPPVALAGAHLAPMAIHFYTQDTFPPEYRHAAFVAFRGGHSSDEPGYKVMALFAGPDGSNAELADFATGFEAAGGEVWGKPVGLTSDPQGNLYVSSDWINNLIIKISPGQLQGTWQHQFPDTAFVDQPLRLDARVRLTRQVAGGEEPVVSADLSALGGPAALPLRTTGNGEYRLEALVPLAVAAGNKRIIVTITQQTAFDQLQTRLSHWVAVLPGEDLAIASEGPAPGWQMAGAGGADLALAPAEGMGGGLAIGAQVKAANTLRGWNLDLQPAAPLEQLGYRALRFAFLPRGVVAPARGALFSVALRPGKTVNLLKEGLVDLGRPEWQVVEIPLERFELKEAVQSLRFAGNLEGGFLLDEVGLVASAPRPPTAVEEAAYERVPRATVLHPNHPNPFNAGTVIDFELSQPGEAELAVFNLSGQRVATLAAGPRAPGRHRGVWDGRDAAGRALASGVYLCQLRVGSQVHVRKLLMVR